MATLTFLLASFLDPVQAALVLVVILAYRGPQVILVAGVTAAVASETIMVLAAFDYTWGELIAPRLLASLLQAGGLFWLVRLVRRPRIAGGATPGVAAVPSTPAAGFGSFATRSSPRRLTPWHMRAYVRRRIERLRSR